MNDRYIESMSYLLVDSVTGHSRRKAQRAGGETRIFALKRAQRSRKARVSKSRWEDLWKKLFRQGESSG
jgi:hypothetical protein